MTRGIVWLVAISAILRFALAAWLPLGTDETYAIAVAREFSWSFFDHPPIGFWLPVILAEVTGVEHPAIYRLPFVIAGTITSIIIWKIGNELGGARVALTSLILYLIAPYMAIGGGVFVVPDGPLNAFLALSCLALIRVLKIHNGAHLSHWLKVGGWLALAMACKYQAAMFPVAVLAFLLLTRGKWRVMATSGPWLAACIGLLGLAPVVLWNIQNDWISFTFHTGRVGQQFQPDNFGRMLIGQSVYLIPTTLVFACFGIWQGFRQNDMTARLLAWLAFVPIAFFAVTYIYGNNTFPHWTMPGWLFAIPLAANWVVNKSHRMVQKVHFGIAIGIWALLCVIFIHIPTGILTSSKEIPSWDNTSEIFDYRPLGPALIQQGWLKDDSVIATMDWIEAGAISTGLKGQYPMRVIGPAPHHFQFMSGADQIQNTVLLIAGRGPRYDRQLAQAQGISGITLVPLGTLSLPRAGREYIVVSAFDVSWN